MHPEPGNGCNQRPGGVQPAQPRDAAVAPESSMEPSGEPSATSARGRAALPAADGSSSERAGMFFCALGPGWRLTGLPPGRAW
jgi:hypothetical protein